MASIASIHIGSHSTATTAAAAASDIQCAVLDGVCIQ